MPICSSLESPMLHVLVAPLSHVVWYRAGVTLPALILLPLCMPEHWLVRFIIWCLPQLCESVVLGQPWEKARGAWRMTGRERVNVSECRWTCAGADPALAELGCSAKRPQRATKGPQRGAELSPSATGALLEVALKATLGELSKLVPHLRGREINGWMERQSQKLNVGHHLHKQRFSSLWCWDGTRLMEASRRSSWCFQLPEDGLSCSGNAGAQEQRITRRIVALPFGCQQEQTWHRGMNGGSNGTWLYRSIKCDKKRVNFLKP